VIEVFNVIEKLTSILSVERLAAQRRRRIGRALLDLHGTLETVLANAQHILARKPENSEQSPQKSSSWKPKCVLGYALHWVPSLW
jgi:hypothetical protein